MFFSHSNTPEAYHRIDAREAKRMIDEEDVVIVDVRSPEEYASGHIAGALLVPVDTIGGKQPSVLPDLGARLVVYCRSGHRSRIAALELAAMGYSAVYDVAGGVLRWPYELVR